jgi:phospholipase/lecithinase/hemolysin
MKTIARSTSKVTILRAVHHRAPALIAILILLMVLLSLATTRAESAPFSRLYVFGDSLSDTGNFFRHTGYPPAPYFNGRFSNGALWVEQMAAGLQLPILPANNYAVAGATTGRDNVNNGMGGLIFPGLQDQVDAFQADHALADSEDALVVVWAGANDFFVALATDMPPEILISNGVYHTALAVVRLKLSGANHLMVLNVPDLGVTPYVRELGAGPQVSQLCAAYNTVLSGALEALAAEGIPTIQVDAFATLDAMAYQPADFGFTNVTQAFLSTTGNAGEFLFWDTVHPTSRGHTVLAREALNTLLDYYSPREGRKAPAASLNALNGLVRTRSSL